MCSHFPTLVHPVIHTNTVLPAALAPALDTEDLNNGVDNVIKIIAAEGNPDIGL